jgi:hypothetical protein
MDVTTLFIIFISASLVVGIVASESDNAIFSTAVILGFFAALELLFSVPIWAAVSANPLTIILALLGYLVAGAVYALVWRWPEYLRNNSDVIKSDYKRYVREKGGDNVDDFLNDNYYNSYSASKNSNYIANWVMSWPLSLLWELARKPAIWIWRNAYTLLANYFEAISKKTVKNVLKNK